ncbi:MBL fold metallo-hydrolase [Patescibacteria group bacterium]|nr:MBL fold metallo-hydrolase [Patescibacteria group bacterium]
MWRSRTFLWFSLLVLLCVQGVVLVGITNFEQERLLQVSFLDVGQGDAILITGPTGIQMLIDGGRDRSVVRELPKVMNLLDRKIEVLVATHPDADHIGGLPEVLERYQISYIVTPGRVGESEVYEQFVVSAAKERGARQLLARAGMRFQLGDGAYADVLYPGDNVSQLRESNDASIVLRVVYKDTEFLLSGDAPSWVEDRLVAQYGDALRSDVLKAGHHGSRTSTDALWLAAVKPRIVVVSAGRDNSYGHPHPEVLERIGATGSEIVSTITEQTITYESDGVSVAEREKLTWTSWWR